MYPGRVTCSGYELATSAIAADRPSTAVFACSIPRPTPTFRSAEVE